MKDFIGFTSKVLNAKYSKIELAANTIANISKIRATSLRKRLLKQSRKSTKRKRFEDTLREPTEFAETRKKPKRCCGRDEKPTEDEQGQIAKQPVHSLVSDVIARASSKSKFRGSDSIPEQVISAVELLRRERSSARQSSEATLLTSRKSAKGSNRGSEGIGKASYLQRGSHPNDLEFGWRPSQKDEEREAILIEEEIRRYRKSVKGIAAGWQELYVIDILQSSKADTYDFLHKYYHKHLRTNNGQAERQFKVPESYGAKIVWACLN